MEHYAPICKYYIWIRENHGISFQDYHGKTKREDLLWNQRNLPYFEYCNGWVSSHWQAAEGSRSSAKWKRPLRLRIRQIPAASTENTAAAGAEEAGGLSPYHHWFLEFPGRDQTEIPWWSWLINSNEENPWQITVNMDISSSFAENCPPLFQQAMQAPDPDGQRWPVQISGISAPHQWCVDGYNAEGRGISMPTPLDTRGSFGEDLYSLPFQNSLLHMNWNKDLFEKSRTGSGTPPQNFEEWTQMAAKITDPTAMCTVPDFSWHTAMEYCLMQKKAGWQ